MTLGLKSKQVFHIQLVALRSHTYVEMSFLKVLRSSITLQWRASDT